MNVIFRWISRCILWFFAVTIAWVIVYKFVPVPVTITMLSNSIQNIGGDGPVFWSYDWTSLDDISSKLPLAVIGAEDQKFPDHFGFDMDAIEKALESNEEGGKLKGGSTISQQTAKNAFLWQGRNWVRKGLEAYFTLLIEVIWGKERIMEVYLNIIEMGDGIYGAQAAAEEYFDKDAKSLNKQEAALIAAVLPSPKVYSVKRPGPYMQKRQRWIMRQMNNLEGINLYGKTE